MNKNPLAERAIQELENEILHSNLSNLIFTPLSLSLITARLNTRIRKRGLSALEMWTQRDQFSNHQLPIVDSEVILSQHKLRLENHPHSVRAKCPSGRLPDLHIGDIVYLRSDLNKSRSRDRYLVVSVNLPWCNVRKFAGSQLRQNAYCVKCTDCYNVINEYPEEIRVKAQYHTDEEEDNQLDDVSHAQTLPQIPGAISDIP